MLAIDSVLECHTELGDLRAREKAAHAVLSTDEQNEKASKELAGFYNHHNSNMNYHVFLFYIAYICTASF